MPEFDEEIALLEKGVSDMENRLFGNAPLENDYPQIIDTLIKLNSQMDSLAVGYPNMQKLFKRMDELEKYLAMEHSDSQPLTTEHKLQMILPMKDALLKDAEDLKKIDLLCDVLGSEHLKVAPALSAKLHKLSELHLNQENEISEVSNETIDLFNQYDQIAEKIMYELAQMQEAQNILKVQKILQ